MHMSEFTYNIFHNRVFTQHNSYNGIFISPIGVQNRDLVQKVLVGTLKKKIDSLCFLIVHYSYSYHRNVCMYKPVTMNERDAAQ